MAKLAMFLGVLFSIIIGRDAINKNDSYCEEAEHSSDI